jgi:hypothetical protein
LELRKDCGFAGSGLSASTGADAREIAVPDNLRTLRHGLPAGRIGRIGQDENGRRTYSLKLLNRGLDLRGDSPNHDEAFVLQAESAILGPHLSRGRFGGGRGIAAIDSFPFDSGE